MPNFYMLVGLSGSGKSSYQFDEEIVKISSDSLRKELFGDENDQTHNAEIFNELHKRVILNLKNGKNVVYDATNLSARRRIAFLKIISNICCNKNCIVFATPYTECIKRDAKRARTVGKEVILKQMKQFHMPQYDEGWDNISVVFAGKDAKIDLLKLLDLSLDIPHNTPYHLETIGEHMVMAYKFCINEKIPGYIKEALLFHDIGKPYAKIYRNSKGERTDVAHYYNHENISSYLYLTSHYFNKSKYSMKVIWLIENHMRPYFNGYEKWKSKQNPKLVEALELLHEYDKISRLT